MPPTLMPSKPVRKLMGRKIQVIIPKRYMVLFMRSLRRRSSLSSTSATRSRVSSSSSR
ncbi:hypothetical protein D3C77_749760 [compost metagenome]